MTSSATCDSRVAQLVYRGIATGALWTVSIDTYDHLGLVVAGKVALDPHFLLTSTAKNCAAFTVFLGTFGGVSCVAESLRGRRDPLNTFLGGFSSGLLLTQNPATRLALPIRTSIQTAFVCGSFAAAFDAMTREQDSS
ncbi:Aste57867_18148 [Aphanomyces stellatus]|uniref:Aste57867_18148 protein n=1 Tax=Aphanomyces stellatus TaxID=120398 RepID=A0A485L9Z2_9STRA|nr:hypothetical protein As57867_018086 [Aphanomyces stellatus]VFT94886.1 Aste57867_18148 [Aphanomyces stellatus]